LWVLPEHWSPGLWTEIRRLIGERAPAGHPQTEKFSFFTGARLDHFYLKLYGRAAFPGCLKDLARDSKAFRALKQGEALAACGLAVPLAVAAGEERRWGYLRRAFLVTLAIDGAPLPRYIRDRYGSPVDAARLKRKREHLRQLARESRRLHCSGFIHGDLVPYNILVREEGGEVRFFYLDNDRTRRYPRWLPQTLWKRNLVQLNRFALPGITLQDRMRFLRAYLGARAWSARERRLIRHLEARTRKRLRKNTQP
jgi:hypothetical protein